MDKTAYDQRKMRAFLLGSLSEAETELFDELSFTDDRFAEELSASEKDLTDAYARGELAGEELASFENHYLASPLRREKAEFASAFQTFTGRKFEVAEAAPETEKRKRPLIEFFAGFNIFRHLDYAFQLGLVAATLLFMILGVWFWLENRESGEQANKTQPNFGDSQKQPPTAQTEKAEAAKEPVAPAEPPSETVLNREKSPTEPVQVAQKQTPQQPAKQSFRKKNLPEDSPTPTLPKKSPPISTGAVQPPVEPRATIASIILAAPLRGGDANQIPDLSISPKTEFVDAGLELETDEFAGYRVELVDLSNKALWQSDKISAEQSADGKLLTVRFPAVNLKPQIYTLVVSGIAADGSAEQISSYPFRVVLN